MRHRHRVMIITGLGTSSPLSLVWRVTTHVIAFGDRGLEIKMLRALATENYGTVGHRAGPLVGVRQDQSDPGPAEVATSFSIRFFVNTWPSARSSSGRSASSRRTS